MLIVRSLHCCRRTSKLSSQGWKFKNDFCNFFLFSVFIPLILMRCIDKVEMDIWQVDNKVFVDLIWKVWMFTVDCMELHPKIFRYNILVYFLHRDNISVVQASLWSWNLCCFAIYRSEVVFCTPVTHAAVFAITTITTTRQSSSEYKKIWVLGY